MSADEFRDKLDTALATAIAGDADLDDVDEILKDARSRVNEVRTMRGEA
jgi:hypothetical protein